MSTIEPDGKMYLPNMRDGYVDLVHHVLRHGKPVSPRGYKTWEIEDATFVLEDPLDALPVGVGREPKFAIGAGEALLLVAGLSDPTLMVNISPTFARFLDGGILHGAYGYRVRPQLVSAVERLVADKDSRQAIVSIWDPLYDGQDSRDVPCTLNFNFRIRGGKLNMSTTMRSNDVWLGTTYDVFMFTQLQVTMAKALGIEVGTYTHHAYSLHLYERNLEAAENLRLPTGLVAGAPMVAGFGRPLDADDTALHPADRMRQAMARAAAIHDTGTVLVDPTSSERWYLEVLKPYDRMQARENFTS